MAKYVVTPQGTFEFNDDAGVEAFRQKTEGMGISDSMWVFDSPDQVEKFQKYLHEQGPKPAEQALRETGNEVSRGAMRGLVKGPMTLPDILTAPNPAHPAAALGLANWGSPSDFILGKMGLGEKPQGTTARVVEGLMAGATGGAVMPGGSFPARVAGGALTGGAVEAVPDDMPTSKAMVAALMGPLAGGAAWGARMAGSGLGMQSLRSQGVVRDLTRQLPDEDWLRAEAVMRTARDERVPLLAPQAFDKPNPLHGAQMHLQSQREVAPELVEFLAKQRSAATTAGQDMLETLSPKLHYGRKAPVPGGEASGPLDIWKAEDKLKSRFPAAARTALQQKWEKAQASTRGFSNELGAAKFADEVFGGPEETLKRKNFEELMRAVARTSGQPEEEVVAGATRLMEVLRATGRGRPQGPRAATLAESGLMNESLQVGGGLLGFGSRAVGAAARMGGKAFGGRVERELVKILTSPEGLQQLRRISKIDPHRFAKGATVGSSVPLLQEMIEE